ncbi:MAG: flagellar brake protein [Firmicutes bacterium]|nr:flagellar brake protein [Bacillota bacterium]
MSLKNISAGDRIVLEPIIKNSKTGSNEVKTYESKIFEITSDDTLEITMPVEQNETVVLRSDIEYDMYVFCITGPYHCTIKVLDNYRSLNQNMLLVKITGTVNQFERRQYFRIDCTIGVDSRLLCGPEVIELETVTKNKNYETRPTVKGTIVDISGGGIRLVSERRYEPYSLVYCAFDLPYDGQIIKEKVTAEVIAVKENKNHNSFEHRTKFYNLDDKTRERIIHYIFEEYRRKRSIE